MHCSRRAGNGIHGFMIASACLILLLLLTVSYLQTDHEKEFVEGLSFASVLDGQEIRIGLWEDGEDGSYYLFLPSCFAKKEIELSLAYEESYGKVEIYGAPYAAGDVFRDSGKEREHRIEVKGLFGSTYMDKPFKVLVSENLPVMMVTVEDREDLIRLDEFDNKKYIETGTACILDEEGRIVCSEKLDKFKIRGNLTATLDKRPFTFSFKEPIGLCGMAPAVKWNLLANATDGSYIRNKTVLELANRSIDAYEPDGEFMEVYLNGQYMGMYLLTEAVEIGENRLAIDPAYSWFLEMELDFRLEENEPFVVSERGQIFALRNAEGISAGEKSRIENMINDIESALFAQDGVSSISGKKLSQLIDMDSWAEMWLIQEISGDHDTGIASTFAYVTDKENPFLYAGPVWDFDGTMGNVNTPMFGNPAALVTSAGQSRPAGNANQNRWLSAMYRNDEFRKAVEDKYQQIFRGKLEEILDTGIELWAGRIRRSAELDGFRWHDKRLDWMFTLPKDYSVPQGTDYRRFAGLESHVNMVKDFLSEKKEFLDKLWIEQVDFCVVKVKNESQALNQDYYQTVYFWVERGTPIADLASYETIDGAHFYYVDADTGEAVTQDTIIWEDRVLEAVWIQEGE